MSTFKNTSCWCADAFEAARSECKAKGLKTPEHGIVYWEVCLTLTKIERRHFGHCRTCQTTEAAREVLGVTE